MEQESPSLQSQVPQATPTAPSNPGVSEAVPEFVSGAAQTARPSGSFFSKIPMKIIAIVAVLLVIVLAVVFAASKFLGTSSQTAKTPTRQVNLVYWGLWEPNDVLTSVIKDFEGANPGVHIQYGQQSIKDYRERLQSAFARGQGPDVFRFHNTWVPMLAQTGALSTLPANIMSNSTFEKTFYPVAAKDLKAGTGYVGVPLEFDGLSLFINKRMLADSGKSAPTTWEDLRVLARSLTVRDADGKIARAGVALGSAKNVDHFSDILALLILQNGGNPGKPDDSAQLVPPALQFYTQFMLTDKVWDETLPNSTYAFATEKAAMVFAPSWRAFEMKQINPNFDFEVDPVPQLPGKPITWASYWAEGVSKTTKDQDVAWKFVTYMSSSDVLQKLYADATAVRLFGEPYPRVDLAPKVASDPYVGAFISQAPNAVSWYMASNTYDNGINDQIIKYYADAINGLNSGKQLEEVMPTLSKGVPAVLAQYKIAP
ncbi:MAG TPA: extracellular solute-binding protein [Patescibacteria group bacterium]|nr:extracellular solute-binding protein [Patescibacteria group bacterium]